MLGVFFFAYRSGSLLVVKKPMDHGYTRLPVGDPAGYKNAPGLCYRRSMIEMNRVPGLGTRKVVISLVSSYDCILRVRSKSRDWRTTHRDSAAYLVGSR